MPVSFVRRVACGIAGALWLCAGAWAQEWSPTKPIKIVVPIVGSTNDAIARLVAPKLQEAIGQAVVV